MTRVLVTGGGGLLGGALLRSAPPEVELHCTVRRGPENGAVHGVDLADAGAVARAWARVRPDVVVHTAFDTRAGEREVLAAHLAVARACRETGAALVHVSTDALQDGEQAGVWNLVGPEALSRYEIGRAHV